MTIGPLGSFPAFAGRQLDAASAAGDLDIVGDFDAARRFLLFERPTPIPSDIEPAQ